MGWKKKKSQTLPALRPYLININVDHPSADKYAVDMTHDGQMAGVMARNITDRTFLRLLQWRPNALAESSLGSEFFLDDGLGTNL